MTPYYEASGVTIYHGEACAILAELPEAVNVNGQHQAIRAALTGDTDTDR